MKKYLVLFLTLIVFSQCEKSVEKDFNRTEKINQYLSDDFRYVLSAVNDAAAVGLMSGYNVDEMQITALTRLSETVSLDKKILLERSSEINQIFKSSTADSVSEEPQIQHFQGVLEEKMVQLFSVFESLENFYSEDNENESFDFNRFSIFATNYIISTEDDVLNNQEITDIDKSIFFSMSFMLKEMLGNYESFSLYVADNFGYNFKSTQGFLKKVWNGVKKAASVLVATVVSTVANVVVSVVSGTGDDGIIDNMYCVIPGVLYGIYYGIVIGAKCDAFDIECLLSYEDYKFGCSTKE